MCLRRAELDLRVPLEVGKANIITLYGLLEVVKILDLASQGLGQWRVTVDVEV